MSLKSVHNALSLLRRSEQMEKTGGVLGTVGNLAKSVDVAGKAAGEFLKRKGHTNLAVAARVAPYAGAAYGGKKAWESDPVQRIRYKYQMWKANRGR